jgi:ribosomal protein L35AE/L33A
LRVVGIRSRHRSFAAGAALAILALSTLTTSPSALASKTGLYGQVNVKASNGYRVFISAERWKHPRRRGKLWISVQRKHRRVDSSDFSSESVYVTHAKLTRHHLKADLGKFGRIALRFKPPSKRQAMAPEALKAPQLGSMVTRFAQRLLGCTVLFEPTKGVFKGRIRFHGESGYTRVRAHQARGTISSASGQCSKVKPSHGIALDAGSGSVRFEADHFPHDKKPLFFAEEKERVGKVAITRSAINVGGQHSFTYPPDLSSAHVALDSEPIVGSANLTSANQWMGSLAATFPGDPNVPLAGPGFSTQLGRF